VYAKGEPRGLRIIVSDAGKSEARRAGFGGDDRLTRLYLDVLGTGELANFELRYPVYMGRSPAFIAGGQIAAAADRFAQVSPTVELIGDGPISTQAIMWAGLLDPRIARIEGFHCLRQWQDVFHDGVSTYAIQPRAHLIGSLESLRALVKNAEWHF
jgi:hypothetical protein